MVGPPPVESVAKSVDSSTPYQREREQTLALTAFLSQMEKIEAEPFPLRGGEEPVLNPSRSLPSSEAKGSRVNSVKEGQGVRSVPLTS